MLLWRNWLAQDAYTIKDMGSSPVSSTKYRHCLREAIIVLAIINISNKLATYESVSYI